MATYNHAFLKGTTQTYYMHQDNVKPLIKCASVGFEAFSQLASPMIPPLIDKYLL